MRTRTTVLLLATTLSFLAGCSSLSNQDTPGRAIKITEVTGQAEARAGTFTQRASGGGDVNACKVETTLKPPTGTLYVHYQGQRCEVIYQR